MRLAVTGKSGQVVSALRERANQDLEIVAVGRPEFDLARTPFDEGLAVFARLAPDAIVSAAAYTAVDKAESEAAEAAAINAAGAGSVAKIAARLGVPVIHISTDYVFDGSKSAPYVEADPVAPLGVYGQTKRDGELAVAAATPNHVILRTAWVYSPFGNNFLKTMLRLAADRPELRVVADQAGNPTAALDIADAVIAIARNMLARPDDAGLRGVFHMAGSGDTTWAAFADHILAVSAELGGPTATVTPITTADYPTPARRPANSRLSSALLAERHGVVMPDWQASTRRTVQRLLGTQTTLHSLGAASS